MADLIGFECNMKLLWNAHGFTQVAEWLYKTRKKMAFNQAHACLKSINHNYMSLFVQFIRHQLRHERRPRPAHDGLPGVRGRDTALHRAGWALFRAGTTAQPAHLPPPVLHRTTGNLQGTQFTIRAPYSSQKIRTEWFSFYSRRIR